MVPGFPGLLDTLTELGQKLIQSEWRVPKKILKEEKKTFPKNND